jgi:hypothetical protein
LAGEDIQQEEVGQELKRLKVKTNIVQSLRLIISIFLCQKYFIALIKPWTNILNPWTNILNPKR